MKLSHDIYSWIFISDSTPAVFCMDSALNILDYSIAKLFDPILEPLTTNEYIGTNSTQIVKEITY